METQKPGNKVPTCIKELFDTVAFRYDLANHLLSLGIDNRWRKKAIALANPAKDETILDMCCGTGDMVFTFIKTQPNLKKIIACDFSSEMIDLAEKKQARLEKTTPITANIQWLDRDCLETGLEDNSFDIISCAFGVRNIPDLKKALAEMNRLVKNDGRICILEFSLPDNIAIRWSYLCYFRFIFPILAGLITGKFQAYRYLVSSVIKWNEHINLENELSNAGFTKITKHKHTFALATTYLARK